MGRLAGRIALVTGGSSGIGRATVEAFVREGAVVVITDVQDDKGEALAATLRAGGAKCEYLRHDVTSEDAWAGIIDHIRNTHGRLDILMNNAGIAITSPSITEMSLSDWRKQQAVNVEGVFLGLKHSLPLMRASGAGGSIINVSSVAGLRGSQILAAYSATKGAVKMLSKSVALECAAARDNIRVNSLHPGIIETPIWEAITPGSPGVNAPPDLDAMSEIAVPTGRKGLPSDIADGAVWLASDEARYVTGLELVIDGGLTLR